jgi:hypothetical protein
MSPESFDDPPRFLSGCVGPYGGRLLPVCCPDMKPPPRWKMWLVSMVAVYPLVLGFQALIVPRMVGLPLPLKR